MFFKGRKTCFGIMCKVLGCLIPLKPWRKRFRNWCRLKSIDFEKIHANYANKILSLKTKETINVVFLVWENCKWSYDSLYKLFAENKKYHPMVVIVQNDKQPVCDLDKNLSFFQTRGYEVVVVKNGDELKTYSPDIIFYEQPWFALDSEGDFFPGTLSQDALCFYVPYSIELDMHDRIIVITKRFYLALYKTFIFNKDVQTDMNGYGVDNLVISGHPKLDVYLEPVSQKNLWESTGKTRIIYAPHHSFGDSSLKWATYEWNGDHILQLAQKYADVTEWVFKPHPAFYRALVTKFGQAYADNVFSEWKKVSKLYDTGGYFDLFRTADLMISDCDSFKWEWLLTGKPYLNLVSQYPGAEPQGPIRRHFATGYYHANNIEEIDKYFDLLVCQHQDPLKSKRDALMQDIPLQATQRIYTFINDLLEDKQ